MGWWSSAAALQGEAANHRKLRRSRAGVVSVAEKARQRVRQVWAKKASASEPLMTCRNRIDDIETGLGMWPGRSLGEPAYCPGGVRHGGGASLVRALVRNVGTCRPETAGGQWREWPAVVAKGEPQAAETVRGRVPMRGTGADRLVVAVKPGNAGGAKGAGHPGLLVVNRDDAGGAGERAEERQAVCDFQAAGLGGVAEGSRPTRGRRVSTRSRSRRSRRTCRGTSTSSGIGCPRGVTCRRRCGRWRYRRRTAEG